MGRLPYVAIVSTAIILASLVFLGMSGMEAISGLRSFVGAEGLLSKSQKGGTYRTRIC